MYMCLVCIDCVANENEIYTKQRERTKKKWSSTRLWSINHNCGSWKCDYSCRWSTIIATITHAFIPVECAMNGNCCRLRNKTLHKCNLTKHLMWNIKEAVQYHYGVAVTKNALSSLLFFFFFHKCAFLSRKAFRFLVVVFR